MAAIVLSPVRSARLWAVSRFARSVVKLQQWLLPQHHALDHVCYLCVIGDRWLNMVGCRM